MKRILAAVVLMACPLAATAQIAYGHRLPEGPERPVRSAATTSSPTRRSSLSTWRTESIAGTATIAFQALRAPLATLSLDAADIVVSKVERGGRPAEVLDR